MGKPNFKAVYLTWNISFSAASKNKGTLEGFYAIMESIQNQEGMSLSTYRCKTTASGMKLGNWLITHNGITSQFRQQEK